MTTYRTCATKPSAVVSGVHPSQRHNTTSMAPSATGMLAQRATTGRHVNVCGCGLFFAPLSGDVLLKHLHRRFPPADPAVGRLCRHVSRGRNHDYSITGKTPADTQPAKPSVPGFRPPSVDTHRCAGAGRGVPQAGARASSQQGAILHLLRLHPRLARLPPSPPGGLEIAAR